MSDQFGFEKLKEALGNELTRVVDKGNVLLLLSFADMYQVTPLLNSCCAFVDRHAQTVLSSDALADVSYHSLVHILSRDSLCVSEVLVFEAVVRWMERNKDNTDAEVTKQILDCVRLTEIPPQALFEKISPSSLFAMENIMQALRAQILPDFEIMKPRGIKC